MCVCALIHCNLSTIKLSSDYDECNAISPHLSITTILTISSSLPVTLLLLVQEHNSFFACLCFASLPHHSTPFHLANVHFIHSFTIQFQYFKCTYSRSIAINYLQYHFKIACTRTSRYIHGGDKEQCKFISTHTSCSCLHIILCCMLCGTYYRHMWQLVH